MNAGELVTVVHVNPLSKDKAFTCADDIVEDPTAIATLPLYATRLTMVKIEFLVLVTGNQVLPSEDTANEAVLTLPPEFGFEVANRFPADAIHRVPAHATSTLVAGEALKAVPNGVLVLFIQF